MARSIHAGLGHHSDHPTGANHEESLDHWPHRFSNVSWPLPNQAPRGKGIQSPRHGRWSADPTSSNTRTRTSARTSSAEIVGPRRRASVGSGEALTTSTAATRVGVRQGPVTGAADRRARLHFKSGMCHVVVLGPWPPVLNGGEQVSAPSPEAIAASLCPPGTRITVTPMGVSN